MNTWQQYGLKQTVAPTAEPVSLAEFKLSQRITFDDEDLLLVSYLTAARDYIESMTARQFVPATWQQSLDAFPCEWLLARSPVQSITAVDYYDLNGVQQTLDPIAYVLDSFREPARLVPAYGTWWPSTQCRPNAASVTFVAGYDTVPELAKRTIMLLAAHWYEHREPVVVGAMLAPVPYSLNAMIQALAVGRYP